MSAPAESGGSPAATAETPWFAPPVFAATAGGLGRVPFAPGTFGAMLGLPLSLATAAGAAWLSGGSAAAVLPVEALLVVVMCLLGIPICSQAAAALRRKDPGAIVLDEVVSMPLALLAVPAADRSPATLAIAFVLLRIFDIGKPFPCRQLERLPAGLGIMADDWGAAAWTAACLAVSRWQHWI
ncbi:MAG: phosphatidylglycerophosphatase A [Planctomycetaceae bacterium]